MCFGDRFAGLAANRNGLDFAEIGGERISDRPFAQRLVEFQERVQLHPQGIGVTRSGVLSIVSPAIRRVPADRAEDVLCGTSGGPGELPQVNFPQQFVTALDRGIAPPAAPKAERIAKFETLSGARLELRQRCGEPSRVRMWMLAIRQVGGDLPQALDGLTTQGEARADCSSAVLAAWQPWHRP